MATAPSSFTRQEPFTIADGVDYKLEHFALPPHYTVRRL
jgi:hypothetical protein